MPSDAPEFDVDTEGTIDAAGLEALARLLVDFAEAEQEHQEH
jgi:hypothetical protein